MAATERSPLSQGERASALRHWKRLLSAVAGSGNGLHVRLFSDAGLLPGRGTSRQDGSHLPEAESPARRTSGRGRLRLGIAGVVHGEALWRDGEGAEHLVGADRLRAG